MPNPKQPVKSGQTSAESKPLHVVGLSGGKDSTALALWLVENEPREYTFICNTTGNELPEMLLHWARLEQILKTPITQVIDGRGLINLCQEMNALPNFRMRWCTRILKIEPTIKYMDALPDGSVLYVGLRADEEMRRGIYGEDMKIRFPLREQGFNEASVWKFLADRNVTIPDRTDCALCPYQRIIEWFNLWKNYPDKWAEGVALEKKTGRTFRSDGRDTWPADMESLGLAFASGREIRKSNRDTTCRVCSL